MTPLEIGVIALILLVIVSFVLQTLIFSNLVRIQGEIIADRVEDLNTALGEAMQNFADMGGMEPPNPILGMLTEVFRRNMESQVAPKIIPPKDEKGQFTSDNL